MIIKNRTAKKRIINNKWFSYIDLVGDVASELYSINPISKFLTPLNTSLTYTLLATFYSIGCVLCSATLLMNTYY